MSGNRIGTVQEEGGERGWGRGGQEGKVTNYGMTHACTQMPQCSLLSCAVNCVKHKALAEVLKVWKRRGEKNPTRQQELSSSEANVGPGAGQGLLRQGSGSRMGATAFGISRGVWGHFCAHEYSDMCLPELSKTYSSPNGVG